MSEKKVWLITGSSRGLGRKLAESALAQGYRVIATARNTEALKSLNEKYPATAYALKLDVANPAEVRAAIAQASERFGRIDVVVNNAGVGLVAAIEEAADAEIKRSFDINLFGALAVTRAVLPILRRQQSGHILNISSFVGLVALPSFGYTSATKFAMEAFSEALAQEVAHLGIKVTIVEPGLFRTEFNSPQSLTVTHNQIEDYPSTLKTISLLKSLDGKQPNDPIKAAQAIIKVVESEKTPLRLPLGVDFFRMVQGRLDALQQNFDEWREVTMSMGFDEQA
jgi:NAD(P)-dependent dehydrogenase (short-subunit alcohol dehydrogenase family)